jgi:PPM family protein phosphatase
LKIRPGIELASLTDVGCQRENNEDQYSYWESDSDELFAQKGRLAIVADGMGGHEGGQEASHLAVSTVQEVYSTTPGPDLQSLLMNCFYIAHRRIQEVALRHPELNGMGTTCTAIVLQENRLYYAHVGDSRLYLLRNGTMSRLTHDHSYVGRLVETGVIRSEEAEFHPQRHILTSALGAGLDISLDIPPSPQPLQKDDVLVLCSDGLWGVVNDREIQPKLAQPSLDKACRDLVELAKQHGGPDNITVQILRVTS